MTIPKISISTAIAGVTPPRGLVPVVLDGGHGDEYLNTATGSIERGMMHSIRAPFGLTTQSQFEEFVGERTPPGSLIHVHASNGSARIDVQLRSKMAVRDQEDLYDEIRKNTPMCVSVNIRYDGRYVCCQCGETDESKMRFDQAYGSRGAKLCYSCKPMTGFERLEKRRGRKYDPGESPDAEVSALLDELERKQHSFTLALFIQRNKAEIIKRGEFAGRSVPESELFRVAEIMWCRATTSDERESYVLEAKSLIETAERIKEWDRQHDYTIVPTGAPQLFTFKWLDVEVDQANRDDEVDANRVFTKALLGQ